MAKDKDEKKSFNIEKFPTSPSAIRMMKMITQNFWYDRSYVGKWIFQVLGLTMDEVTALVRSLYEEAFPETCTWTIGYWEQKHGLPIRDYLPLEERRKLVIWKRDTRAPISPYNMEQILGHFYRGVEINIADINDPGPHDWKAPHPNVFCVSFEQGVPVDPRKAWKIVDWMKQSHTTYIICLERHAEGTVHVGAAVSHTWEYMANKSRINDEGTKGTAYIGVISSQQTEYTANKMPAYEDSTKGTAYVGITASQEQRFSISKAPEESANTEGHPPAVGAIQISKHYILQ